MTVTFGGLHWEVASGKIADFVPADADPHVVDISGSVPSNCVAVLVEARKMAGTSSLWVYPNSGTEYSVLATAAQVSNRTALGGFVPIIDQELKLENTGADGDWDIYIYGYLTQG